VVSKFAPLPISRSLANFETKTTLGIIKLIVSFRSRNSPRARYQVSANFGIGTLDAPGLADPGHPDPSKWNRAGALGITNNLNDNRTKPKL
jgi:hypothetical protein